MKSYFLSAQKQHPGSNTKGPGVKKAVRRAIQHFSNYPYVEIIPVYIDGDYILYKEFNLN